jgi:hypothetical protein
LIEYKSTGIKQVKRVRDSHTEVEAVPDKMVSIDLYNVDICLFFSPEGADLYLHTVHGTDAHTYQKAFDDGGATKAIAFKDQAESGLVCLGMILPEPPDGGLLAHECLHIVDFICDEVGIDFAMETMEPRAYLLHYIFDKVQDAIDAWQKENPEWPSLN